MAVQLRPIPDNAARYCKHRLADIPDVLYIQLGYFGIFVGISQRGE